MNKHLLIGSVLLVAMGAFSQNGKLVRPSGIIEGKFKKVDFSEVSTSQSSSLFTGPTKQIKHKYNNGNKTTAVNATIFTGAMNVFSYLYAQANPLQYNKSLNAISFLSRKSSTYTPSSNNNSGAIVALWSTNLGSTWDETCIWTSASNFGRFPSGGIYNPSGNTNINNAYIVGHGPVTDGANWTGVWYASKPITTPGTTTPGSDQQFHDASAPVLKKHHYTLWSNEIIDGGLVRGMGMIINDIAGTTNLQYGPRGTAMLKGQFNAGAFVWSVDSFCPPVNTRSDGSRITNEYGMQAWNDAGTIGYVVILGSRAGAGPTMNGYQPIVYMTSNSGASWSLLPANDFADPCAFKGVNDRLYSIGSSTVICPNFNGSEDWDVAVDANGQLHLATMTYGHYSNHVDSLGYRNTFGTEQYAYSHTAFDHPTIYDFYTKASGGWDYHIVDSMGTEGPSGVSGEPGFTANSWTGQSPTSKMDLNARIQISRTDDGQKLFYSWTESDTGVVGLKWNIYPDLMMKGYDVMNNKVTPRMNITTGVLNADQNAYFHFMSNKAIGASSGCVTIPYTITYNATYDGISAVDDYYLNGVQVCAANYSINPLSPKGCALGIENKETVNYEVMNFPNPANHATTIIVGLKEVSNFEIAIYNSIGQLIDTYKVNGHIGSNEINIDLSGFNAGVYFYNVKVGSSVVTKKLVVQ
jgi:hypothetical protein